MEELFELTIRYHPAWDFLRYLSAFMAGAVIFGFSSAVARCRRIYNRQQKAIYLGVLLAIVMFAANQLSRLGDPLLIWQLPLVLGSEALILYAVFTEKRSPDQCR